MKAMHLTNSWHANCEGELAQATDPHEVSG
jgi:hypothetical protein